MAPQDAWERYARYSLAIEPADHGQALKLYAQVHDVVSQAIEDGVLTKQRLGAAEYCKLVRLLGTVGAMWKERKP